MRELLLLIVVIVGSAWPSGACHYDQMDTCPHVQYLNLQLQQVIPLPDPDNLKTVCDNIGEGFRCLLGPSVLGNCPAAIKAAYEAMQKASEIPCFRNKQEYEAGRQCWRGQDLLNTMKDCYSETRRGDNNACSYLKKFRHCTLMKMLTVSECGVKEKHLMDLMMTTYYNKIALASTPTCDPLTTTRPTTTTTTTPTTTRTVSTATPATVRIDGRAMTGTFGDQRTTRPTSVVTTRSPDSSLIVRTTTRGKSSDMVTQASTSRSGAYRLCSVHSLLVAMVAVALYYVNYV